MSDTKINLYEKIINIRVEFQKNPPKATGNLNITQNQSFNYLELKDFLPKLNQLCAEYKIFNHISFSDNIATLKIIDIEEPTNEVVFETPFISNIQIGKCNAMQNCGGAQTYARRYLYYLAYDIQANDLSDYVASRGLNENTSHNSNYNSKSASAKQIGWIKSLIKKADTQTKNAIKQKYDLEKLSAKSASEIIELLKDNPKPKKEPAKEEIVEEEFPECLQDNDNNDIIF